MNGEEMKCGTCGIEGHDSQGSKELCLVAVVARHQRATRELSRHLGYVCMIAERLGPVSGFHREEALEMLKGTVQAARKVMAEYAIE